MHTRRSACRRCILAATTLAGRHGSGYHWPVQTGQHMGTVDIISSTHSSDRSRLCILRAAAAGAGWLPGAMPACCRALAESLPFRLPLLAPGPALVASLRVTAGGGSPPAVPPCWCSAPYGPWRWAAAAAGAGGPDCPLWRAESAMQLLRTLQRRTLLRKGRVAREGSKRGVCELPASLALPRMQHSNRLQVANAQLMRLGGLTTCHPPCRPAPVPPHSAARCFLRLRPVSWCHPSPSDQKITAGRQGKNEQNEKQKLGAWVKRKDAAVFWSFCVSICAQGLEMASWAKGERSVLRWHFYKAWAPCAGSSIADGAWGEWSSAAACGAVGDVPPPRACGGTNKMGEGAGSTRARARGMGASKREGG